MNSSDKYFWMYDEKDEKSSIDYTRNNKADEKKIERIRKNIAGNGVNVKPQESVYNAPVPEKNAQTDYKANNGTEATQTNNANNQGANKNPNSKNPESLEDVVKKLNQQPNSQSPNGNSATEKIMEEMPNLLMYEAGKIWNEINGVLVEGADPELMDKSNSVAGYILGDPKSVVQKVRNDVAGHLLYKGMNLLKQYKEKVLGK